MIPSESRAIPKKSPATVTETPHRPCPLWKKSMGGFVAIGASQACRSRVRGTRSMRGLLLRAGRCWVRSTRDSHHGRQLLFCSCVRLLFAHTPFLLMVQRVLSEASEESRIECAHRDPPFPIFTQALTAPKETSTSSKEGTTAPAGAVRSACASSPPPSRPAATAPSPQALHC